MNTPDTEARRDEVLADYVEAAAHGWAADWEELIDRRTQTAGRGPSRLVNGPTALGLLLLRRLQCGHPVR